MLSYTTNGSQVDLENRVRVRSQAFKTIFKVVVKFTVISVFLDYTVCFFCIPGNSAIIAVGGSAKKEKETAARREAVDLYVVEVEDLWIKAFGKEHVVERQTIAWKLSSALQVNF